MRRPPHRRENAPNAMAAFAVGTGMHNQPTTVVLVDDDAAHVEMIRRAFESHPSPFRLQFARNLKDAREIMKSAGLRALVIADVLPSEGLESDLVSEDREPEYPLVVLTSRGDERAAVAAIRAGAVDYIVKSDESLRSIPDVALSALAEWHRRLERQRAKLQLEMSQRMESVSRLAGSIAHDVNNLLTIILGFADIASTEIEATDPANKSLQQIRQAAERACDLTKRLLTFASRPPISKAPVDLSRMVRDSERAVRQEIGENVELIMETESGLPIVNIDQGQMQEVLVHLASNASEAMDGSGRLTISTSREDAPDSPDSPATRYVCIKVTDTGRGITPETRQQIFEPYFTTRRSGRGTGLGLAISFGIIHQHQGTIDVDSQPGRGATFTIRLPVEERATETANESVAPRHAELPTGSETILVVEDESLVRTLTTRVLRSLQYNVLQAVDGEDALAILEDYNGSIDLLLTDVVMPNLGGLELARRLRERYVGLRILYVSGYSGSEDLLKDITQSKAAFLPKPFSRAALAHKVRRVLDDANGWAET